MGHMPPHDPTRDPSCTFVVARVAALSSPVATVSAPARVTFEILEVTRPATTVGFVAPIGSPPCTPTPMPSRVEVSVGATRSFDG